MRLELVRLRGLPHSKVSHQATRPRRRILRPRALRTEALQPSHERAVVVIEMQRGTHDGVETVWSLTRNAQRRRIGNILGKYLRPGVELLLIEQRRLVVDELEHFVIKRGSGGDALARHRQGIGALHAPACRCCRHDGWSPACKALTVIS